MYRKIKPSKEYSECWYCDNIVSHRGQLGLLYLGFPRCFVLFPDDSALYAVGADFDTFLKVAKVNWLDPSEEHTEREKMEVLVKLYNFSVEQERMEEDDVQAFF